MLRVESSSSPLIFRLSFDWMAMSSFNHSILKGGLPFFTVQRMVIFSCFLAVKTCSSGEMTGGAGEAVQPPFYSEQLLT